MEGRTLVYKKHSWMNSYSLYKSLIEYMTSHFEVVSAVSSVIDPAEADHFAKIVVNIFTSCGKTLPLIKSMIFSEFSRVSSEGEGSLLRGNSVVSKVEGQYVRCIGGNYLKLVIGDILTKIATDSTLNLEVDPRKISFVADDLDPALTLGLMSGYDSTTRAILSTGMDMDEIISTNQKQFISIAQQLLDHITDPVMVEAMPREIRAIAGYTAMAAKKYAPSSVSPLVGGFVMLRFFTPAIACPDGVVKILPADVVPNFRAKRNFVLLAKLLQNTSNGVLFGQKEEYMICMNKFITDNKAKMAKYLRDIAVDPFADEQTAPWEDMDATVVPSRVKLAVGGISPPLTPTDRQPIANTPTSPTPKLKTSSSGFIGQRGNGIHASTTPSPEDKPGAKMFGIANFSFTKHRSLTPSPTASTSSPPSNHSLTTSSELNSSTGSLSTSYKDLSVNDHPDIDIRSLDLQDLFELHRILDQTLDKLTIKLKQLNTPTTSSSSFVRTSAIPVDKILQTLIDLGPSPKTRRTKKGENDGEATSSNGSAPVVSVTAFEDMTTLLDRARFLYQGPNDKSGKPVFYLIVNRLRVEFMENVNPLVSHIFKVMDSSVTSGYRLIVDMSWANVGEDLKRAIYSHLPKLARVFSRKYKKNVLGIYIVHPSAYTRAVVYFMRLFTSRKLKNKIFEIYNWKELTKVIDQDNIMLPETSKDYITKSYQVVKVNAKGKRQDRLIKFTSNSLLNVDPKTRKLQNEKSLDEIEEISCKLGSCEIQMRFVVTADDISQKNKSLFGGSQADLEFRRYVCETETERDNILQDFFESGFKTNFMKVRQEYRVVKVNQVGKHQERTFKLTCDSLLNLSDNKIQSETSFAGIEGVHLDGDPDIIWMKLKAEPFRRKIICKGFAKQLYEVLSEAMLRYQQGSDFLEGELKNELNDEEIREIY
eukprot:TRINITY_DN5161_c0_g1_i1.p1 TRINITY_DN5161_c0_g1~~TRINITY_DN5161_c0_g1_i1.p1  ORF type:complete len:931 (-),score=175.29 TRINITY_DN5161_c0_g1_i1:271-3063(-)